MVFYSRPQITEARQLIYDGTNWVNQKGDSEGKVYIRPYVYTAGPETYTSTGTGTEIDTIYGIIEATWQIISDSSSTNIDVKLQGSIDGSNWFDLDEFVGVGNTMRHVVNKPVRYLRANVVSMGDASSISIMVWGIR